MICSIQTARMVLHLLFALLGGSWAASGVSLVNIFEYDERGVPEVELVVATACSNTLQASACSASLYQGPL
jgi:hypothetical protein